MGLEVAFKASVKLKLYSTCPDMAIQLYAVLYRAIMVLVMGLIT